MNHSVPSDAERAQKAAEPARSSRSQQPFGPGGRSVQLAAIMNSSPQAQALTQLKDDVQQSPGVQRLMGLAAEINQGEPAQLRGVPVNDDVNLEREADLMGAKALAVQRQPASDNASPVPVQRAESAVPPNHTGLPDQLKSGVESLSGMSLDSVKVHYNSAQPAQLNALAFAQGADIHVAPGQEQHLPHEAWHVVQQAQGRVQQTMQMKQQDAEPFLSGKDELTAFEDPGGEPIQRVIGDAGEANTDRVVHDRDNVVAKIKGVVAPKYLGPKWPKDPTIYALGFYYNESGGFALGQDPNYWLVGKKEEEEAIKSHGQKAPTLIPLRSPVLQGLSNGTYVLDQDSGAIKPGIGGTYADGNYPFVILANGALSIANDTTVGHTGLAEGNAVLMAGELTITAGKATYRSCQTGHYYTTPAEEARGIEIMKASYSWIGDLSPKGPAGKDAGLGLLAFGMAPGSGTYGHQQKMKENFVQALALWKSHKKDVWVVDVLMQSLTNTVKRYTKLFDEEDDLKPETIKTLTGLVKITGDMLRDMKAAIDEHQRGLDVDEPRPDGLEGYDGTNPFEEED